MRYIKTLPLIIIFSLLSCSIYDKKIKHLSPKVSLFNEDELLIEKYLKPIIKKPIIKETIIKIPIIKETVWGIGKISWFGGPNDVYRERILPCFLYPKVLVGDLNPNDLYCAMRFKKKERKRFKSARIRIEKLNKEGEVVSSIDNVKIMDWGPGPKHRIIDVSPRIMKALEVTTDKEFVRVILMEKRVSE